MNAKTLFLLLPLAIISLMVACKKEKFCEQCGDNKPPIAVAGPDQATSLPADSISLDGSASNDPDGKITHWLWTKISGPSFANIADKSSAKTIARNLVTGVYQFELKVTDDKGLSAKDTLMVTVSSGNHPPVACAGTDQTLTLPTNNVLLDGSCSTDPENNIVSFLWQKISGPSNFNILNAGAVQTQATNLVDGVYQFEVKVTDAAGLFAKDTIKVTVSPDLSLAIEWQKAFGGTGTDIGQSIQHTLDGGYILAGSTNSQNGDVVGYHPGISGCYRTCFGDQICEYFPDALIIKLSSSGAIQWQKSIGGSGADYALCIEPTGDGGYIMSGYTYSNDGDVKGYHGGDEADAWVVKLSSNGVIQWQKVLGGSTGCEFANQVLPTSDGGYIVAGHTDSHDGDVTSIHGGRDVWIIKLSSSGDVQWQKTIGGTADDYAYSIQSTSNGGCIIAGYTESHDGDVTGNHGAQDVWVAKLSSSGAIEWQKALGGINNDYAYCIQSTADGGYIVAGYTESNNGDVAGNHGSQDAWIVKLSGNGTIQWQKTLGGTDNENARSIQPTSDGGYIVAGYTYSVNGDVAGNHGNQDAWVLKLSSSGDIQWQKALGGTSSERAQSIQPTADGGYIVAGQTYSNNGNVTGNHGDSDAWVIKLKQ
jgi:hypothetical protein